MLYVFDSEFHSVMGLKIHVFILEKNEGKEQLTIMINLIGSFCVMNA